MSIKVSAPTLQDLCCDTSAKKCPWGLLWLSKLTCMHDYFVMCFSDKNAFILELQKLLFMRFKKAKVFYLGFSGLNLQL